MSNIYEGAFLQQHLTAFKVITISTKSSVIDIQQDPKSQLIFTCSKSTIETVEKGAKYVQSQQ